jgi:iron(III) transport system permease protein
MTPKKFSTLGSIALAVVLIAAVPLIFVIYSSLQLHAEQWLNLWSNRLPRLLWNTFSLALLVAVGCFVLGVSAAWWIARRSFPGRNFAVWLMILPLAIPTYVFAHIYTSLLEEHGWLGQVWLALFGNTLAIPDIYNVFGATVVLSLAGFSYVFLLARSALSVSTRSLEEAATIQGASKVEVFFKVNLPLLRPAIAAGLSLVVLHVLSDFGAVSMLQYQTFTLSIYLQMSGRFDYQAAAGLSLVLVLLSLTFLVMERFFRTRQRYYSTRQARQHTPKPATPWETTIIWSWLGLITLFAFGLPLAWMIAWSWDAWVQDLLSNEFWGYAFNSLIVAILAASAAVGFAFPIAFYHNRRRSLLSNAYLQSSSIGFVLPGPVVALGIISFMLAMLPWLYGGFIALLLALVIRFLPLAVQSQDATLQQLTPSIELAGRSLGAGPLENLWLVILPTLILRPTGFDTLPVRIWIEASEEMLELAAPAALMLVVGTLPIIWIMMKSEKRIL